MASNTQVEREGSTLTVSFLGTPPAASLVFGVPFLAMGLLALFAFGGVGLIALLVMWRLGGPSGLMRATGYGILFGITPFLVIGLFIWLGISLIRSATKPIYDDAEVWVFNRADRSFTTSIRKREQRTGRRWLADSKVYSFPAPGSAFERIIPTNNDFDDITIVVQTSSGEVVGGGTPPTDYAPVVAQINQLLAGN